MTEKTKIPPPETETVTTHRVACDGGEGALGHPRVWLSIDDDTGCLRADDVPDPEGQA